MSVLPPRFGVWANVYGTWASRHHPDDPPDASWERNRRLVQEAEELGFTSTLIAQHITGRQFGLLGEPRVNVLLLNLDLDQLSGK